MLTPNEKIRLIELQEKEKEPHTPLTEDELKYFSERAVEHSSKALGNLQGFTEMISSIGEWSSSVAKDNIRLLLEVQYYKSRCEELERSQITQRAVDGDTETIKDEKIVADGRWHETTLEPSSRKKRKRLQKG